MHLSWLTPLAAVEPPAPFGAVPAERQVAWQRMEYYGFVHFGLNTYTDREWGYGDEDGKMFNPKSFDARAIVHQFKEAGMTGMIFTAKHHDGFCLWQTKTTAHNISESPWKNGKGDVLRDFADACKAEGMKLGIYVSPWDRNNAEYARPGYVATFHNQIREVLTNYGPIFEIWFDGANGGDGFYGGAREKRGIPDDYYQFSGVVDMVRKLQPDCVIWGPADARWGGSEQGFVNYPQWHTMDSTKGGDGATGVRHGDLWKPAEGDTSIRPGWFWHAREDRMVKSPEKLLQTWLDSVGRGANLILNVPPNKDGGIAAGDVKALMGFKKLRDELLSEDFAAGAEVSGPVRGNDLRFSPVNLTDSDVETYWGTDDGVTTPTAELRLSAPATFDTLRLREQIRLGQRVDSFAVDAWKNGAWQEIHAGLTIGNQVIARLAEPVTTDRLRLRITASAAVPCISGFSLLKMPAISNEMVVQGDGHVSKGGWKIVDVTIGSAELAIDGDPKTLWHTFMGPTESKPPQGFTVDFGKEIPVTAFTYLPRQDGIAHGMTDRYRFELSRDGETWGSKTEGGFSNILANPTEQIVPLEKPVTARYLRFTGLHAIELNHVTAAEVGVISVPPGKP